MQDTLIPRTTHAYIYVNIHVDSISYKYITDQHIWTNTYTCNTPLTG